MLPTLRCAGCHSALRMRPEYLGKKLRCPRCHTTMSVPTIQPDDPPLLPLEEHSPLPDLTSPPADREHPPDLPSAEQESGETTDDESTLRGPRYPSAVPVRAGRLLLPVLVSTCLLLHLTALGVGPLEPSC
jgi:phage FluMu protein Com